MRHDLRNALDEAHPEDIQASAATVDQHGFAVGYLQVCSKCGLNPPPGDKLQSVGAAQQSPSAPKTVPRRTGRRTSFSARACVGHTTRNSHTTKRGVVGSHFKTL
jgi:hypothetical protein